MILKSHMRFLLVSDPSRSYLTKASGTVTFVLPEALVDILQYDTALDAFSYGRIMLYTVNGE